MSTQSTVPCRRAGSRRDLAQVRKCRLEKLEDRYLLASFSGEGGAIPDPGTLNAMLEVPDDITIADINVTLSISHGRNQDLDVFLISPANTRVELFTDVGGNDDGFFGTTLDDEAATSIVTADFPFTGTYRPEGTLASLNGENAQGTWMLEVTDDRKREAGTLDSWSIGITGSQPSFSIDDVQLAEGDSGSTTFEFIVTRSGDTSQVSTVDFTTVAVTAEEGMDYAAHSGTLQFDAGAVSAPVAISVFGDTEIEADESFTVQLTDAVGATISDAEGIGTILDDDATPNIDFFPDFDDSTGLTLVNDAYITADNVLRLTDAAGGLEGAAWFDVQHYASVEFTTSFQFQLTDGAGGSDNSDGFAFVIQNDSNSSLRGGGGTLGYLIPNSLAIEFDTHRNGEIGDPNDNHVSVQSMGTETNSWEHDDSLGWVTPSFDMTDGQPHSVQIDYEPGTLSIFLDGQAPPALTVPVNLAELLDLNHGQAWFGFTAATGGGWQNHDILNWQYTQLADTSTRVEIGDAEQVEGDAGEVLFSLPVTLHRSGDTSTALSIDVNYQTVDGTATTTDGDYDPVPNGSITLTLAETESNVTEYVTVYANGDEQIEAHEQFYVDLISSPATIVESRGQSTILNDDTAISIDDVSLVEGAEVPQFIGRLVTGQGAELDFPSGLEIVPGGDVYVSSVYTDSVLRYDGVTGAALGALIATGQGGLQYPGGLAFGTDGNLYVCSQGTDQILKYDASGTFLEIFVGDDPATTGIDESGGLDWANEMVFASNGDLYVSSRSTNSVLRYDADGTFVEVFVGDDPATADVDESGGLNGPEGLTFDAAGDLYVASSATHGILRYDGESGDWIDAFVPARSGGLAWPHGVVFQGSELFVSSAATDAVLRYDATGEFIDEFAPAGSGGLDNPRDLAFGDDGNLYVNSGGTNEVLRYGDEPAAVFTVSLESASVVEVTVSYDTEQSTVGDSAAAGTDYVATSGLLTFAPGATSRVIVVPIIDDTDVEPDETFSVELFGAAEATISDNAGTATIINDDWSPTATKFYVADASSDQMFEYNAGGQSIAGATWSLANNTSEGAASNLAGDRLWVVDRNGLVYVYGPDGDLLGNWEPAGLNKPKGIATDGQGIWIIEGRTKDPLHKEVLFYEGGASWLSGSHEPTSSMVLPSVNENPTGITTDGTYLWITDDDSRNEDNIWSYAIDGGEGVGSFNLPPENSKASGVTIDPTGASRNIWVIDSGADAIFEYRGTYGDEPQELVAVYPLAAGNTNPQGIADPLAVIRASVVKNKREADLPRIDRVLVTMHDALELIAAVPLLYSDTRLDVTQAAPEGNAVPASELKSGAVADIDILLIPVAAAEYVRGPRASLEANEVRLFNDITNEQTQLLDEELLDLLVSR